jgi:hypothetical protein
MTNKFPICPDLIRTVPEQFSWVDHRLVRDHHIDLLTHEAAVLYLFLVTVADAQGLSYYSDPSISARLAISPSDLLSARRCLVKSKLVAYRKPLYQVLPFADTPSVRKQTTLSDKNDQRADVGSMAIDEILRKLGEGTP